MADLLVIKKKRFPPALICQRIKTVFYSHSETQPKKKDEKKRMAFTVLRYLRQNNKTGERKKTTNEQH